MTKGKIDDQSIYLFIYYVPEARLNSVQFSHSVVSDSLWPHGLQHARPPCPSPDQTSPENKTVQHRQCVGTVKHFFSFSLFIHFLNVMLGCCLDTEYTILNKDKNPYLHRTYILVGERHTFHKKEVRYNMCKTVVNAKQEGAWEVSWVVMSQRPPWKWTFEWKPEGELGALHLNVWDAAFPTDVNTDLRASWLTRRPPSQGQRQELQRNCQSGVEEGSSGPQNVSRW